MNTLEKSPKNKDGLDDCPFCDGEAETIRLGTRSQSAIASCTMCGATVESSDIGICKQWNHRAKSILKLKEDHQRALEQIKNLEISVKQLEGLINSPETIDFAKAVVLEAAHQLERWGHSGSAGKKDTDWFWLIGYLTGKAMFNPVENDCDHKEKQLHRIITIAAACANWHSARLGGMGSTMRPGIEAPDV